MTKYDTLFHQQLLNILLINFIITVDNLLIDVDNMPGSAVFVWKTSTSRRDLQKKRNIFIS